MDFITILGLKNVVNGSISEYEGSNTMAKVTIIKCDNCNMKYLEIEDGISFMGEYCLYCGTKTINDKKILHRIKIDEAKLDIMGVTRDWNKK